MVSTIVNVSRLFVFTESIVFCIHNRSKTVSVDYVRKLVVEIGNERLTCILSDARNNGTSTLEPLNELRLECQHSALRYCCGCHHIGACAEQTQLPVDLFQ